MKRKRVLTLLLIPGLIGLALVAWGVYLLVHKGAADLGDYAKAQVTIDGASIHAAVADTIMTRSQGLSDRPSMREDEGMLFIFPIASAQTFWMKDMHFDLDLVWIKDGAIAGITPDVPAPEPGTSMVQLPTYASPVAVDQVLEVVAGTAAKHGWKAGDAVQVAML